MSSSSVDEISVEVLTHVTREQRIILSFDFYTNQGGPPRGAVVLRFQGFGVVTIVGIDPEAARIGDIVIEIAHSGFHTRAEVWVKVSNGSRG
ncbi:unnamed protein product [Sphagnum troendelagicum]